MDCHIWDSLPRSFSPFCGHSFFFHQGKTTLYATILVSEWYNNSRRSTENNLNNFQITIALKTYRLWAVWRICKDIRKASHPYLGTYGSLQKNITMTSFSSFQCWATGTREVREASLMVNCQENLVSMVSRELCLCNVRRRKADLQLYRNMFFSNNTCLSMLSISCLCIFLSIHIFFSVYDQLPWTSTNSLVPS